MTGESDGDNHTAWIDSTLGLLSAVAIIQQSPQPIRVVGVLTGDDIRLVFEVVEALQNGACRAGALHGFGFRLCGLHGVHVGVNAFRRAQGLRHPGGSGRNRRRDRDIARDGLSRRRRWRRSGNRGLAISAVVPEEAALDRKLARA